MNLHPIFGAIRMLVQRGTFLLYGLIVSYALTVGLRKHLNSGKRIK